MANILIRSDEANAVTKPLSLAARSHCVCLLAPGNQLGVCRFSCSGKPYSVASSNSEELSRAVPRVGIFFAKGEDVRAGTEVVQGLRIPEIATMSELAHAVKVEVQAFHSVIGVGEVLLNTDLTLQARVAAQRCLKLMKTARAFKRTRSHPAKAEPSEDACQ